MIDEFLKEQKITTTILKNAIKKDKISHAYLFETNGYPNKEKFVLAFVKHLLCPNNYSDNHECGSCQQCNNIEKGIFSELKHIYPDGMWIKKEQLEELQKDFSETSVQASKRIYVIHNAEQLNTSAANSILKFLEEPEKNIIAILMTDNIHQLLDTIVSRCQIISFARNNNIDDKSFIEKVKLNINMSTDINDLSDDMLENKIDGAIKFILYYEDNKLDTVLHTQKLFHKIFINKNEIIMALEIINLLYLDVIKYKINNNIKIFNKYKEKIEIISKKNSLEDLFNKIKIILEAKENVKYNINTSLLVDKLIIDMEGGVKNG